MSSEIVLPKLIERLMTIALEHAGANRGLLILSAENDYSIQAEAQSIGDQIEVVLCGKSIAGITCPESLVRYVIRTHERVIVDDASTQNLFSEDDYLRARRSKSILCLPMIKQGQLTGLLYLENTLTSHAFTADRTAILELLAAQAAISLENARLYRDLAEREAKIRRLVEANIIGVFIGDFDGRIVKANDAFLRIVGYDREDLAADRINWKALTPQDWRERDAQWIEEHKRTGVRLPIEKEYFRKGGGRVPVLLGSATVEEGAKPICHLRSRLDRAQASGDGGARKRAAVPRGGNAAGARELRRDDGAPYGLDRPRSEPADRCYGLERRDGVALARR